MGFADTVASTACLPALHCTTRLPLCVHCPLSTVQRVQWITLSLHDSSHWTTEMTDTQLLRLATDDRRLVSTSSVG